MNDVYYSFEPVLLDMNFLLHIIELLHEMYIVKKNQNVFQCFSDFKYKCAKKLITMDPFRKYNENIINNLVYEEAESRNSINLQIIKQVENKINLPSIPSYILASSYLAAKNPENCIFNFKSRYNYL